jgi:hypothetical protein
MVSESRAVCRSEITAEECERPSAEVLTVRGVAAQRIARERLRDLVRR